MKFSVKKLRMSQYPVSRPSTVCECSGSPGSLVYPQTAGDVAYAAAVAAARIAGGAPGPQTVPRGLRRVRFTRAAKRALAESPGAATRQLLTRLLDEHRGEGAAFTFEAKKPVGEVDVLFFPSPLGSLQMRAPDGRSLAGAMVELLLNPRGQEETCTVSTLEGMHGKTCFNGSCPDNCIEHTHHCHCDSCPPNGADRCGECTCRDGGGLVNRDDFRDRLLDALTQPILDLPIDAPFVPPELL